MTRKDIFERLGTIVEESSAAEVDWSSVTEDSTIESLGFDSLTILDLLFELEAEFGREIEAKEILEIKTLGEMVTFLEDRL